MKKMKKKVENFFFKKGKKNLFFKISNEKKIGVQGYNQLIYRLTTSENRNDLTRSRALPTKSVRKSVITIFAGC